MKKNFISHAESTKKPTMYCSTVGFPLISFSGATSITFAPYSSPIVAKTSNYKTAKWLSEYSSSARKLYFSHRCLNIFKGNTAIPHSIDIERGNASKIHRTAASFIFNKLFKIFYNTHALNVVSWQSQELDSI